MAAAPKSAIPSLPWNKVRPAPIVLVTGPESFLAERASVLLRETLRVEDPALEVHELRADEYAPGELLTLASPSLFGEPRLLRVTAVEKCNDAFLAEAIDYLAAPAEGAYLLLRHAGGVRGKKLLEGIRAGTGGGIEVVCAELKSDRDRLDFVLAEFTAGGRRITPGAAHALVTAFADDLAELAAACRQLISDATDEVTEATVDRYYSGRVETNAFKVADAALAGRLGEALVLLRHAIAGGADPVPIVAAFAMKLRTMAKVAGGSRSGMAPWQIDRARRDLQGWRDEGLGAAIEAIADADARVKGAGRDPEYALERMVAVIAARGERPRA